MFFRHRTNPAQTENLVLIKWDQLTTKPFGETKAESRKLV